jgi:hypothetical protein
MKSSSTTTGECARFITFSPNNKLVLMAIMKLEIIKPTIKTEILARYPYFKDRMSDNTVIKKIPNMIIHKMGNVIILMRYDSFPT